MSTFRPLLILSLLSFLPPPHAREAPTPAPPAERCEAVRSDSSLDPPARSGAADPPPPTGEAPDRSLRPNEPRDFRPLSERRFDRLEEDGWRADLENPNLSLTTDRSAPVSGPRVGEIRFPAGSEGGRTPAWSENWSIREACVTELYVSFWVKLSENWQGHPSGVNKITFFWIHDDPAVFAAYHGSGRGPLSGVVYLQNVPDGGSRLRANVGRWPTDRGDWHHWEVLLISNTGSDRNGEVHWWIDGTKLGEHTNLRFGTAEQGSTWERVAWRPIWGGLDGRVAEDMYMRMDRIYISGRP